MAGAAIKACIANINASMYDIDEDLLVDATLHVPNHMPKRITYGMTQNIL
jgi:hypothetical protein